MKCKLFAAAGITALMMAATPASAVVISQMDGDHDIVNGNNSGDLGTAGLGHTVTLRTDNAAGWTAALGSGDPVIIVEQSAKDGANVANVSAWVTGGGRLIVLGGTTSQNLSLINAIFGTSMSAASTAAAQTFTKTAAAAGTTFADDPMNLLGLNSHHEVVSGALPAGSQVFYEGASEETVFRTALGAGDVFYFGYDYCCGGTAATRNDWYTALDSAITFNQTVPEPGTLALFGLGLAGLGFARRRKAA